jgi:hypothetical protein
MPDDVLIVDDLLQDAYDTVATRPSRVQPLLLKIEPLTCT